MQVVERLGVIFIAIGGLEEGAKLFACATRIFVGDHHRERPSRHDHNGSWRLIFDEEQANQKRKILTVFVPKIDIHGIQFICFSNHFFFLFQSQCSLSNAYNNSPMY